MAAVQLEFFSVFVSLFLLADEFSWTMIVRMSPMPAARLSANI